MFGQNPIRSQDLNDSKGLATESIFYTIQGEGPLAGAPAVFIRLAGCWLACHFCDTQFETGINNFRSVTSLVDEAVKLWPASSPLRRLVVLTGGDPLRQNVVPLCSELIRYNFHVQIETAGVRWLTGLSKLIKVYPEPGVSVVISPKTGKVDVLAATFACAWKYIIRSSDEIDDQDGLPNSSTQTKGVRQRLARPPNHGIPVYVQPCDEYDHARNQSNVELVKVLAMRHGYRVSLQTHKILGLE